MEDKYPQLTNENHIIKTQTWNNKNYLELWYRRLRHRNLTSIKEIKQRELVRGIHINNCKHSKDITYCEPCIKEKLIDEIYPKISENKATDRL